MNTLRLARAPWAIATVRARLVPAGIVCGAIVLALTMAYGPIGWGIERVTVLALAAPVFIAALSWRRGIYIALAYVIVEGAVANILYPSVAGLFIKDALVMCAYAGFAGSLLKRNEAWLVLASVVRPFLFLVAIVVLGGLNPNGVPILVTLIGVRTLLLYVPLYALGFHYARDADAIGRLVRFVLITSLPIVLFGIYQYVAGPEALAALGEGFERTVWMVGTEATEDMIYRPASTFAFVGFFGAYLCFITLLSFTEIHSKARAMGKGPVTLIFWCSMVAVVLQSQRTTWVFLPIAVVLIYVLNGTVKTTLRAAPVWVAGVALAVIIGAPVLQNRLPVLIEGGVFADRIQATSAGFASTMLTSKALIGHGTGMALGAARHVTGQTPGAFESGWYGPFYMFGIWGVLVYAWLYAAVLHAAWRGLRALPGDRRWLPSAIFTYLLLTAAVSGPINYPPTNIYFWLFAGALAGGSTAAPARTPQ
ncbi:MAG: hypothetical protein HYS34_04230 [Acidobacteria bacterium]|nr:hypothetical protein [Acidobacteriota bacterium]